MNEHAADQIVAIYERYAIEWDDDRKRASWNDKPWHDRFVACLTQGATVLDLGCGSGMPVAHNIVQHGRHVTGVDSSPTMISLCRNRMPEQEWIVSDMRAVALGRRFNGILGWDSFFFLRPDDQRKMFNVFAAHASPSAFLMFNTLVMARRLASIEASHFITPALIRPNTRLCWISSVSRSCRTRSKTTRPVAGRFGSLSCGHEANE